MKQARKSTRPFSMDTYSGQFKDQADQQQAWTATNQARPLHSRSFIQAYNTARHTIYVSYTLFHIYLFTEYCVYRILSFDLFKDNFVSKQGISPASLPFSAHPVILGIRFSELVFCTPLFVSYSFFTTLWRG